MSNADEMKEDINDKLGGDYVDAETFTDAEEKVFKFNPNEESIKRSKPFDVWTMDSIEFDPSISYLVKGLIDPGAVSVWQGEYGSGKTFVMFDLAYHIATGKEWHGRRVEKSNVLYTALEGKGGIINRVLALKKHYAFQENLLVGKEDTSGLKVLTPPSFFLVDNNVIHRPTLHKLIATIKEHEIKFVVIDTLSIALGGSDENNQGMLALVGAVREISATTDCHVAVVHHPPKSDNKQLRGHSSLGGAVDLIINLDEEDDIISLETKKVRDHKPSNFLMKMHEIEVGTDEDGDVKTSMIVKPFNGDSPNKKKSNPVQGRPWELHQLLPRIFDDLRRAGKAGPHRIGDHRQISITRKDCELWLLEDGFLQPPVTDVTPGDETCNTEQSNLTLKPSERTAFHRMLVKLKGADLWGSNGVKIWDPTENGKWVEPDDPDNPSPF